MRRFLLRAYAALFLPSQTLVWTHLPLRYRSDAAVARQIRSANIPIHAPSSPHPRYRPKNAPRETRMAAPAMETSDDHPHSVPQRAVQGPHQSKKSSIALENHCRRLSVFVPLLPRLASPFDEIPGPAGGCERRGLIPIRRRPFFSCSVADGVRAGGFSEKRPDRPPSIKSTVLFIRYQGP